MLHISNFCIRGHGLFKDIKGGLLFREGTNCLFRESKESLEMKIEKINPGGVFLIFLVLLQPLELSAAQNGNRIIWNPDATVL